MANDLKVGLNTCKAVFGLLGLKYSEKSNGHSLGVFFWRFFFGVFLAFFKTRRFYFWRFFAIFKSWRFFMIFFEDGVFLLI